MTCEERRRIAELEQQVRELRRQRDPQGSRQFLRGRARPAPAEVTRFIEAHRDRLGVEPIWRTLQVAPATYYAARRRPPSARALRDAELEIARVHKDNFEVYGVRKVWRQLGREGIAVGRDRVARLMRGWASPEW